MVNLLYNNSYFIILIPIGLLVIYYLLKYPEVSFALFISAYVLKGGMNFGYFNITTILLIITVLGFILPFVIGGKVIFTFQKANI